jgi:parvulin-like peptidyl-prolyl isomerase
VGADATKRTVAIGLGVALVLTFAAFATGLDNPDVPDDAVAVVDGVDDGTITREEFDGALKQVAASQGLQGGVPKEDDPQFDLFKEQALSDLILSRWIEGEASDRRITVSDREVEQRLAQIQQQNFGSQKEFENFLDESGFTEEEALQRVKLTLLSERLQEGLVAGALAVAEEDIETVYDQQLSQFQQDESRDVRVIVNKSEEKVEQAKSELEEDDSPQSWERVAKEFSTDDATKDSGGLRENVVEGEGDPAFDEAVFGAEEGELVGPFETEQGFNLVQVVKVTPAETTPLEKASKSIRQQLESAQQQAVLDAFEEDLTAKWSERTFCAADFAIERCENFEGAATDSCTLDDPEERTQAAPEQFAQGCPPFVTSRNPASPVELSEGETAEREEAQLQPLQQPYLLVPGSFPQGLPQRPFVPAPAEGALPAGVPPGVLGPGGAPPTGAPPTGAPPTGAPPTGAPPTGAPPAAPPPQGP